MFPPQGWPSVFPTDVRTAFDVVRKAVLVEALHEPQWERTLAGLDQSSRPSAEELVEAAEIVEAAAYTYLRPRFGERLERRVATELYHAQSWSTIFVHVVRKPKLTVCHGRELDRFRDENGALVWSHLRELEGCGVVYEGRVRGRVERAEPLCRDCSKKRTRRRGHRRAAFLAGRRGLLEHSLWAASDDPLRPQFVGTVRIGRCSCGSEFRTTDLRQTRCEECRRRHRVAHIRRESVER